MINPEESPPSPDASQSNYGSGEEPPLLHRLFVGSVPRTAVEATLRGYFELCGVVRDLAILRDRSSGKSRGCAFVSYLQLKEAETAIQKFDRRLLLPGSQTPLEVRFAKNHSYVPAGDGPQGNRQLFFSRVLLSYKEEDILPLFEAHGKVVSINIFKCRRSGRSKGCGFVEMQTRAAANTAIEKLDEKHVFDGSNSTMSVRWADPDLQLRKKVAVEDINAYNKVLFFAKVQKSTTEEDVRQLFSRFGKVHDVNLFRAFQGAASTKGCGLVTMSQHEEAVAAIAVLDGKHVWEGMDCTMVVKWMDITLQRRRRQQHLVNNRHSAPTPSPTSPLPFPSIGKMLSEQHVPDHLPYQPSQPPTMLSGDFQLSESTTTATDAASATASSTTASSQTLVPHVIPSLGVHTSKAVLREPPSETPPPGCNRDVVKLFVGNIPKSCSEEHLLPLFQSVGKVVELVIVYDKLTHESKGSAFVWYETREDVERAILRFNQCHAFPDHMDAKGRPLVVRRAKARSCSMLLAPVGLFSAATLGEAMPSELNTLYNQQLMATDSAAAASGSGDGGGGDALSFTSTSLPSGLEALQLVDGGALGMGLGMHMDLGMDLDMEVGSTLAGSAELQQQAMLFQAGLMEMTGDRGDGSRSNGRGGGDGLGGVSGSVGAASGTESHQLLSNTPGIMMVSPAEIYDSYGAAEHLLVQYGGTASMMSASSAAVPSSSDCSSYSLMLPSCGGYASPWDVTVAAAASLAASGGVNNGSGTSTTLSLLLTPGQFQHVNQHLFSVQAVSGVSIQLSVGGLGMFQLIMSGSQQQVETARQLLATVVGGAV